MDIKTYRVPQYSSRPVTVIVVNGEPLCTVRGNKSISNIIAKLNGYDIDIHDGRIEKKIREIRKEICE